jgi:5-methylcytosine-specific restriction endonuclease McrA
MRKVRQEWFRLHPPDHTGYYYCALCGKALTLLPELLEAGTERVQLDHILSRNRNPELRFELTNLQPVCGDCNREKGSEERPAFFR